MGTGRSGLPAWSIALLAAIGACGDPPLAAVAPGSEAGGSHEVVGFGDVRSGADAVPGPDGADATEGDATAAADAMADTPAATDGGDGDAGAATRSDAAAPDGGSAEFAILASDPTAGAAAVATKFTVTVIFSADVKKESATAYTISVRSQGVATVPCKFSVAGKVLTIAATTPAPPASRVDIVFGPLVQSQQGVPLAETTLSFYTATWPDQAGYAALAARFAPIVRQAVGGPDDLLRRADFDGEWNLANNPVHAASHPALAAITWAAVETRSHIYLTWLYYWPARPAVAPGVPFDNDTAGAQVVIERGSGQPVALQTLFKAKGDEQAWLWLANEAGWPVKSSFVRKSLPRDALFPAADPAACAGDPKAAACVRRFPAWLTAGSHQSCLWIDAGEVIDQQCALTDAIKSSLKHVVYSPAAAATEPPAPTVPGSPAAYALLPLLDSWWPRRDEAGPAQPFADTQFTYQAPAGRPLGPPYGLGGKLVSGKEGDFGRPPWAWRWKPGTLGSSYYDLPRGAPFFDPAWLLWQRLGGATAGIAPWSAATPKGFSVDYCFNPYLGIDVRGTPDCP